VLKELKGAKWIGDPEAGEAYATAYAIYLDARRNAAMHALRAQTRLWGGSASIMLPCTKDFADDALFWELIEAQDPDAVVVHPGTYDELLERWRPTSMPTGLGK
jgi:hypothetical protein